MREALFVCRARSRPSSSSEGHVCYTPHMRFDFTKEELRILRPVNTPRKIQDFLDAIPMNFEVKGDTCLSPRRVLRERTAHCMEGAMLAAVTLRLAGWKPLVVDLKSSD